VGMMLGWSVSGAFHRTVVSRVGVPFGPSYERAGSLWGGCHSEGSRVARRDTGTGLNRAKLWFLPDLNIGHVLLEIKTNQGRFFLVAEEISVTGCILRPPPRSAR
jgi:hypothetical protein